MEDASSLDITWAQFFKGEDLVLIQVKMKLVSWMSDHSGGQWYLSLLGFLVQSLGLEMNFQMRGQLSPLGFKHPLKFLVWNKTLTLVIALQPQSSHSISSMSAV